MAETVLQMNNIHKKFPGVYALKNINFELRRGEVHALLGENGAGKSTLIKVLAGIHKVDEGEIIINGKPHVMLGAADSQAQGISVIHQELCLVPDMTVAENIFLGRENTYGITGFVKALECEENAARILAALNTDIDPGVKVKTLSTAQQQIVEIAKALSIKADIIVMDEPTASLTGKEVKTLFDTIENMKARGISVIYISHRLEELFAISDRVTVIRDGEYIGTAVTKETSKDELISMMVGRTLTNLYQKQQVTPSDVIMEVKNLSRGKVLKDISFSLRKGEILGLSGLVGAGRTETARCLFGIDRYDSGEIIINGKSVKINSVSEALGEGIALVPESRKEAGLVLIRGISYNITLPILNEFMRGINGGEDNPAEKEISEKYVADLRIKASSIKQQVRNLSGGNQQKVVIAKWLATKPKVLILDEPTRGVDVGAKVEIYGIISSLAMQGVGIIMISSDLPEVVNMSDRVLVMSNGKIAADLGKEDISPESIMRYATVA